jgi:hypothetical protein
MRSLAALLSLAALGGTAAAAPAFGDAKDGLRIGLEVADARGPTVAVTIENVTDHPITLLSHVDAGEKHYDWYTIDVAWPLATVAHRRKTCGGRGARAITLIDDRTKAARVEVTLAAHATLRHEIDLGDWASRQVNGARPLGGGVYELAVTYAVANETGVWNGTISSGSVALARTGPRALDMCDTGWPAR